MTPDSPSWYPPEWDDWVVCTECSGREPESWFCTACGGHGGWEPSEGEL